MVYIVRGEKVSGEAALKERGNDADERLCIEAAQKDPSRFAELYERNFERVYAYIIRRVRDRDEAEDLTSDVFHQGLANLGRFEWRGAPFGAWLIRIAANAIADRSKRLARVANERDLADAADCGQTSLDEAEHRGRLFRLVDGLPRDQRQVIVMRFGEQKTISAIAGDLGRSEGAIKQLQFRGLQNLRTRLGETNG
jgi:RNA polymerase sigma-70 factor (ECF subfamily)